MISNPAQTQKNVSIYFDLITSLKTTREVANFLAEIDSLKPLFFKSETISLEKALASINTTSAQKITDVFAKSGLDPNDRNIISGFFETLKELIGKLKVIKLTLAFDPTHQTIEKIHNFVKEAIGVGYILDTEISEDILGGAVIMFNGQYHDFSLKKDLEATFKTKKDQVLTLLG